jgi:hypothetical protein
MLAIAWFSYDFGRNQPVNSALTNTETTGTVSGDSDDARVTLLKQERDRLQQQVAELQQQLQQARVDLNTARTEIQLLGKAAAQVRAAAEVPARASADPAPRSAAPQPTPKTTPVTEPAAATTTVAETDGRSLELQQVRLAATAEPNRYQLRFTVRHAGNNRVTGTIWIAVNGFANGNKPVRLSFSAVSSDQRGFVKMGFNQQQDVDELLVLPAGFRPKNVQIEAKPYSDDVSGTSLKYDWVTG